MFQHEEFMYSRIINNIKKDMDEETFKMSEELIKISVRIVVFNIAKKYENQLAFESALNNVMGNVVNFIALVIMQLKDFGGGKNEGPFVDLFERLLNRNDIDIV